MLGSGLELGIQPKHSHGYLSKLAAQILTPSEILNLDDEKGQRKFHQKLYMEEDQESNEWGLTFFPFKY